MTVEERARRVRLLLFDVDGVLTDGIVVMHADGSESKGFHIRDGAAIVWAQRAGLPVGLLSARSSGATAHRAAQLAVRIVQQGVDEQGQRPSTRSCRMPTSTEDAVAYMGDDLLDLPVLTRVRPVRGAGRCGARSARGVDWVSTVPGAAAPCASSSRSCCARRDAGTTSWPSTAGGTDGRIARHCSPPWSRCSPASPSARRGSATSSRTAAGSIAAAARESPHYMLGLNFLVANQIDPAIDELTQGGGARRRSARDPPDPRQPVPREGPGRPRDPGAPGAAAAAEPPQAGTRQRPALPGTRLQERRLRRPRARGVHRSAAGSIPTTATRCRTSRSSTRSSTSGTTPTRRGRSWRRWTTPSIRRAHLAILAFLENELGTQALKRMDYAEAARPVRGGHRARRHQHVRRT